MDLNLSEKKEPWFVGVHVYVLHSLLIHCFMEMAKNELGATALASQVTPVAV